jgi:hypothetical protein
MHWFSFLAIVNDDMADGLLKAWYGAGHELMKFENNNQELAPESVYRNTLFVSRLLSHSNMIP